MKVHRTIVMLQTAVVITLSACHTPPVGPGGRPLEAADYGPPPKDVDREIRRYLDAVLKDPDTAKFEHLAGPKPLTVSSSLVSGPDYGWGLCFRVNAKNSYGGFTGYQTYAVLWRNGSVVYNFAYTGDRALDLRMTLDACQTML